MPLFGLLILLAWPGAAERRDAIEQVRDDTAYQTELPLVDAGIAPEAPRRDRARTPGREGGQVVASMLMWALIALVLAAVVIVAVREMGQRPASAHLSAGDAPPDAAPVEVEAGTLDDAEALARAGRYAEAIHVLLLRTFSSIGRQAALPDAYTSREILARVSLVDEARAALRHLVLAVEVSLFGGAEPGPEDYARCRASFQAVLSARGVSVT